MVKELIHSWNTKTKVAASIDFKPCSEAFESSKFPHVRDLKGFLEVVHYCNNFKDTTKCVQDR